MQSAALQIRLCGDPRIGELKEETLTTRPTHLVAKPPHLLARSPHLLTTRSLHLNPLLRGP